MMVFLHQTSSNSTCSSHAQYGGVWKFIVRSQQAVSVYPFQSFRNVAELRLSSCGFEGGFRLCTPSSFFIWRKRFTFHILFRTKSDRVACFLYVLTEICILKVPFRLNWGNWRNWRGWTYPQTSLPVLHLYPLTCIQYEGIGLRSSCPFVPSRIGWLVFCMIWRRFVYSRSHSGWIGPIGEIGAVAFE